jgi:hypothetical protein
MVLGTSLDLIMKRLVAAQIEKGESGSDDEAVADIKERLQIQDFNDPLFRKKYDHLFDFEKWDEEAVEKAQGVDGERLVQRHDLNELACDTVWDAEVKESNDAKSK